MSVLRCPVCSGRLALVERAVRCPYGHAFDVARQGYVNLRSGAARGDQGDAAAMVDARAAFLAAGHFAPLARALAERVAEYVTPSPTPGIVADAGAGTGYYLAEVLRGLPGWAGLALDISVPALRRAAHAHPAIGAVGCDVWRSLPVASGSVDAVLNVFAPRNPAEFRRILTDHGLLLVVLPADRHLAELVAPLGLLTVEAGKQDRLHDALAEHFTDHATDELTIALSLPATDATRLVEMGPSARHLTPALIRKRVGALPQPIRTTAAVRVRSFRPR